MVPDQQPTERRRSTRSERRRGASGIARMLDRLERMLRAITTVALMLLIGVILANVLARHGLGYSLIWAQEAAIWLFVSIIFLALPLAQRAGLHLSLTVLVERLPDAWQRGNAVLVDALLAGVTLMLLLASLDSMARIGGISPALGLPLWLKYWSVPLGCGASLIFIACRGVEGRWPLWHGPLALALGGLLYLTIIEWQWLTLTGYSLSLVMIATFVAALLLGVPVAFAMLLGVFVAGSGSPMLPPAALVQNMVNGVGKFLLLAIPFFLTVGTLMNAGGLSRRLMDFAFSLVGHLRAGHAQVSVVSSLLYGGVSGSSYSEAALSAKLLVPQMIRHGYSAPFACAITASSGILPNMIPPSIALLIVAAVANLSVGSLWLAGIGPGLLIALCLMITVHLLAGREGPAARGSRAAAGEMARKGLHAVPVVVLAVIILGGIRFGMVTPTEAGVLAVVYAGFLGMVVYREYGMAGLWAALSRAAVETALVGLLIGAAAPFAFILVAEQVPQSVIGLLDMPMDRTMLLLSIILLLLLFGMMLDIGAAILILTPLLMPLGGVIGIDPIHFALVIVVALMLGGLTPPVGMLAYIVSTVTATPVHRIFPALLPFIGALLVALLIIAFVPGVSIGILQLV